MCRRAIAGYLAVWLFFGWGVVAHAQSIAETDFPTTVSIPKDVHFLTLQGESKLVPAGAYHLEAASGSLMLFDDEGVVAALQADWEAHTVELDMPIAVSLAGEVERGADNHYLAILLPGGTSLQVTGTYSGIRPRGRLLKAASNRVSNAAKQSAASVQKATKQAQQAMEKASNRVAGAIPGGEIQQLVGAANSLGLTKLMMCLNKAKSAAPTGSKQKLDIAGMASRLQSNPSAFVQELNDEISGAIARNFDRISGPDLDADPPSAQGVINQTFDAFDMLATQSAGTKCLFDFAQPFIVDLRKSALKTVKTADAKFRTTFQQSIGNRVNDAVFTSLKGMLWAGQRVALDPEERKLIASGIYSRSITRQFANAATALEEAIQSNDVEAVKQAIRSAQKWNEQASLEFGFEMIRVKGRRSLYIIADAMLDKALNKTALTVDFADGFVGSLCGLVPEVGAVVCEIPTTVKKAFLTLVARNLVKNLTRGVIMRTYEQSMACIAGRMNVDIPRKIYLPIAATRVTGQYEAVDIQTLDVCSQSGPVANFLMADKATIRRAMLATVERDLPPSMRSSINAYNQSLLMLADQWESRR